MFPYVAAKIDSDNVIYEEKSKYRLLFFLSTPGMGVISRVPSWRYAGAPSTSMAQYAPPLPDTRKRLFNLF
jgi:hypothetical protein